MNQRIIKIIIFLLINTVILAKADYNQLAAQVQIELASGNFTGAYKILLPELNNKEKYSISDYENILWYASLCSFKTNKMDDAETYYREMLLSKKNRLGKNSPAFKQQVHNLIQFLVKEGYPEKAKNLSRLL